MSEIINYFISWSAKMFKKRKNEIIILVIALFALDFFIFGHIIKTKLERNFFQIYFLDVGQGDSQFIILPGGAKILIDGGPINKKILNEIANVLSPFERRIDIVLHTHPQTDHFGGLIDIVDRYRVSSYASNGILRDIPSYLALKNAIDSHTDRHIVLRKGDIIRYGESKIYTLHPRDIDVKKERDLNNSSLVFFIDSAGVKSVLTADISKKIENSLIENNKKLNLSDIDILKVSHHGSKNSSSKNFLKAMNPKISVIQVGKNGYGHPSPQTLELLREIGTEVYRNDTDGTIKITSDGEVMRVYKSR